MKKSILFFTAVLTFYFQLFTFNCNAQLRGINYQAVAIDENGIQIVGMDINGQALNNKTIGVRFSILSGSSGGSLLYQETHSTNTDPYGLFSLIIGDGIVTTLGQYQQLIDIPWSAANQFLKVEIDITNTGSYRLMSIQQFMAVPYTFYALKSDTSLYAINEIAGTNWELTGNDSTDALTNFLGTTDSVDLVIKTDNIERMRVTANGNVGIGMANPTANFEVNGFERVLGNLDVIGSNGVLIPNGWLRAAGTGDSYMMGNVGIGTATPSGAGLGMGGGNISGKILDIQTNDLNAVRLLNTSFGFSSGIFQEYEHTTGDGLFFGSFGTTSNHDASIKTYNVERITVKNTGNVGIGTTTPSEKLEVAGNARISGLAGIGLRMVQTDLNGTLLPLAADSADKVLLGTGVWGSVPTSTAWSLLGNTGTSDSLNFIGTLDAKPLNIRVNNQKSGRIDHISRNTFWGYRSGTDNTTGTGNTANGAFALDFNTTGIKNAAFGYYALTMSTTGDYNTAIGADALFNNTTGISNTALGEYALSDNTSGNYNTSIGSGTLYSSTTGNYNAASGTNALYFNLTGNYNTAEGPNALYSNTTGNNNIGLGAFAGYNNSTGSGNVFLGHRAGYNETGSNKLYIANDSINPPLIYGDFSTGNVGIGTTNAIAKFHINDTIKGISGILSSQITSIQVFPTTNQSVGASDKNLGTYSSMEVPSNNDKNINLVYGNEFDVWNSASTISIEDMWGSGSSVWNDGTGTTFSQSIGAVWGSAANNVNATISNGIYGGLFMAENKAGTVAAGVQGILSNATNSGGDIDQLTGIAIETQVSGGTVTDQIGVNIAQNHSAGIVSNRYGIFIEAPTGLANPTNDFGIYEAGLSQKNYFAGNVGIGTTMPAAMLEVAGNTRVDGLAGSGTRMLQTDLNGTLIPLVAGTSSQVLLGSGVWGSVPTKTAWSLLGNDSTVDGINFIGTTDNKPLNIRVNNQKAGRIDPFFYNTFWGYKAGNANINGTYSTANGAYALTYNTTGDFNTADGAYALSDNSTGDINTANGAYALSDNTTGDMNTANGAYALSNNITGDFNTANGAYALFSNISGTENIAFGLNALYTCTTGGANTALGYMSLNLNETGNYNTGVGYKTLFKTKADSNTAVGAYALYSDITGFNNTATGYSALYFNTTGKFNTANGVNALYYNTTGNANTASGNSSLRYNTTGSSNSVYGVLALHNNTSGSSNTVNGYQALYSNVSGSNATAMGFNAMQYANNTSTAFDNYNVAVGFEALRGSTSPASNTGNNNTSVGYQTLKFNSAGSYNTANGSGALYNNTGGNYNTASGTGALAKNTNGSFNTAIGSGTLDSNTVGQYNTAIGVGALLSNTIGTENTATGGGALYSNTTGQYNTATGNGALYSNTTANDNSAYGEDALKNNITGYKNSALGENALYNNTTGYQNTADGMNALENNINGINNTALGYNAFNAGAAFSNSTALGYDAQITSSNTIQLGNTSITDVKTSGSFTAKGYTTAFSTKTSNYTLAATDDIVSVTGTTTITLPTAIGITGRKYTIKNIDAAATVSVNAGGAQTIDGIPTILLTIQYKYITVVSNGANWLIVANN